MDMYEKTARHTTKVPGGFYMRQCPGCLYLTAAITSGNVASASTRIAKGSVGWRERESHCEGVTVLIHSNVQST